MQISADLENSVGAQFEADGVVCPLSLKRHCLQLVVWTTLATTQVHVHLKTTQLPPKHHRKLTFISFFRMSSILKVQNFYYIEMFPRLCYKDVTSKIP